MSVMRPKDLKKKIHLVNYIGYNPCSYDFFQASSQLS